MWTELGDLSIYVYRQSQVAVGSGGLNVCWSWGRAVEFKFVAWSSIAQSVCQRAFSLLAIWCLRPWWVRILHSAVEDNLSPFDSNIACLCQSIDINNMYLCMYVCMYVCVHVCVCVCSQFSYEQQRSTSVWKPLSKILGSIFKHVMVPFLKHPSVTCFYIFFITLSATQKYL